MTEAARHDAWQAADSYDAYMGRWSRQVAPRFLDWLGARDGRWGAVAGRARSPPPSWRNATQNSGETR